MKYNTEESMEDWANRVHQYEYGHALQQLAKGQDVNVVMEAMAARIQQKMLHPVLTEIRNSSRKDYDMDKERQEYFRNLRGPIADHIVE